MHVPVVESLECAVESTDQVIPIAAASHPLQRFPDLLHFLDAAFFHACKVREGLVICVYVVHKTRTATDRDLVCIVRELYL